MACLFTSSGAAARQFRYEARVGNVGINVGVAAPMAYFPFSGWKDSFFGDLHAQGRDAIDFYTEKKIVVGTPRIRSHRATGRRLSEHGVSLLESDGRRSAVLLRGTHLDVSRSGTETSRPRGFTDYLPARPGSYDGSILFAPQTTGPIRWLRDGTTNERRA